MKPLSWYQPGKTIHVHDKMQKNYSYVLSRPYGDISDAPSKFTPALTPSQMLSMGVFEGKYLNDCYNEFPIEWYYDACIRKTLSIRKPNPKLNFFKLKSRMSLREWRNSGWIYGNDVRGWFQWYCRYYIGRRDPIDSKQINRWIQYKRHFGQVRKNCKPGDLDCRPKQRQSLLQWSYNPFIDDNLLSDFIHKENLPKN
jgi:hypothetical protein